MVCAHKGTGAIGGEGIFVVVAVIVVVAVVVNVNWLIGR